METYNVAAMQVEFILGPLVYDLQEKEPVGTCVFFKRTMEVSRKISLSRSREFSCHLVSTISSLKSCFGMTPSAPHKNKNQDGCACAQGAKIVAESPGP